MKRRHFTLLEALLVIVILALLSAMLFGLPPKPRRHRIVGLQIDCLNNLKQIGKALSQYATTYDAVPAYSAASAATTTDANLCAANLTRLYSCGLIDNLDSFRCRLGAFRPNPADENARPEAVRDAPDGAKYTSYNLTTCYDRGDPGNRIIVADMPYALGNVTASVHDEQPDKIDLGPNCLYKDGHVANCKNLCPEGSSEYDLSPGGNIYRVDGGGGKGKDTCILGVEREQR